MLDTTHVHLVALAEDTSMPYTDEASARKLIERILELKGWGITPSEELRMFKQAWSALGKSTEEAEEAYIHLYQEECLRTDDYTILLGYMVKLVAEKTGENINPAQILEDLNQSPEPKTNPNAKR